ncbi:sensor histidine kinase [Lacticaseibacillus mingshuiensis]|uniref:Signal transduction histidine-protein kinase ArlS n=1 Tax=Lacticaseibacillus mingshuiensis TaxID=2799574 RepID=A0ABW4CIR3_9LACO|nr:HAMP domain-containing histidine kinase [Lacticaseibacillus mingshuiensis]
MKKQAQKRPRRFSLSVKWTAVVTTGVFTTFIVLALILVAFMRAILIQEEQNNVQDTLNAVEQRLSPVASNLTIASVVPRIDVSATTAPAVGGTKAVQPSTSIFSDSVVTKISREDISLAIYNKQGEVIFSSRANDQPLNRTSEMKIYEQRGDGFSGLIGGGPITSSRTGEVIGYVQITDQMDAFHSTMHQVYLIITVLAAAALAIALALAFFMTRRFMQPIKLITNTIDIVNEEPQSSVRIPELRRNDELGDLVNEFNGMLDRIQQFIDQQGEFVQDVSHELRTPVAVLEGHLQLLNRWGKDDPQVLDESLAASLQEITRMKRLIREMLDLTRADQVDVQFPNAVCDIHQAIDQVVNDFKMVHPEFTFLLDNELDGPVWVRMYRNHLEQVLIILLDNAVKYSKDRKEIQVSAGAEEGAIAIAVQDFGEGISPKDRERVFNRFYRVDKARSREAGGNGLGLAIAQRLVESYHGHISVDSALGHGSIFRITLPTITEAKATALQASAPAKPELHD